MRKLVAFAAMLSIVCGFSLSAAARDQRTVYADLEPVSPAQLDDMRAGQSVGFAGFEVIRSLASSGVVAGLRTADAGGTRQIDPPSLQLDTGTLEAWGRAGLRYSYRQTDLEFVRRVSERLRHRDR